MDLQEASIGGVLRYCNAAIKVIFFKSIRVVDLNVVELLAVWEALQLFVTTRWASSDRLVIESDSSNVVNWMLNLFGAPWSMKRHMAHIENFKQQLLR